MRAGPPRVVPAPATHRPTHPAVDVRRFVAEGSGPSQGSVVHDHGSVAFYLDGSATMWVGAAYTLRRGDVLLVPEGAPHYRIAAASATGVGVSLCMSCLTESWGAAFARALDEVRRGAAAARRIEPQALEQLERHLDDLERELAGARPGRDLAIAGLLSLVGVAVARASAVSGVTTPTGTPLVARALAYIEAHALDGISLRDVARAVHRAPAHLAAVVKQETGRTVVEWITHARMAFARQLLLRSDATVEAVAERVGFASASHFHRTFRRLHAVTPTRWRTLHRDRGDTRGRRVVAASRIDQ